MAAKRPDYHTDHPVPVRFPPDGLLLARLDAFRARHGLSRSAAILKAVREACDRDEAGS